MDYFLCSLFFALGNFIHLLLIVNNITSLLLHLDNSFINHHLNCSNILTTSQLQTHTRRPRLHHPNILHILYARLTSPSTSSSQPSSSQSRSSPSSASQVPVRVLLDRHHNHHSRQAAGSIARHACSCKASGSALLTGRTGRGRRRCACRRGCGGSSRTW